MNKCLFEKYTVVVSAFIFYTVRVLNGMCKHVSDAGNSSSWPYRDFWIFEIMKYLRVHVQFNSPLIYIYMQFFVGGLRYCRNCFICTVTSYIITRRRRTKGRGMGKLILFNIGTSFHCTLGRCTIVKVSMVVEVTLKLFNGFRFAAIQLIFFAIHWCNNHLSLTSIAILGILKWMLSLLTFSFNQKWKLTDVKINSRKARFPFNVSAGNKSN